MDGGIVDEVFCTVVVIAHCEFLFGCSDRVDCIDYLVCVVDDEHVVWCVDSTLVVLVQLQILVERIVGIHFGEVNC